MLGRVVAIFAALVLLGSQTFAQPQDSVACSARPPDPNSAVFRVINAGTGEDVGSATLINSTHRFALTAMHLLPGGVEALELKLKIADQLFDFDVVLRGNNSSVLTDDWALIQIREPNEPERRMQLAILPDLHLIYDLPSDVEFSSAKILLGNGEVLTSDIARAFADRSRSRICAPGRAITINVNSYAKGHSGSVVYSPGSCGVIGLTSRLLPGKRNIQNNEFLARMRAEITAIEQATLSMADRVLIQETLRIDATLADTQDRISRMERVLTEKNFVRIVPIRCMVDELVTAAWTERRSRAAQLLQNPLSDRISVIMELIRRLESDNRPDERIYIQAENRITTERFNWSDILQLRQAIEKVPRSNPDPVTNGIRESLRVKIASKGDPERWSDLGFLYGTLQQREAVRPAAALFSGADFTELSNLFVLKNSGRIRSSSNNDINIDPVLVISDLNSNDKIVYGQYLADLVERATADPSFGLLPATARSMTNVSVSYIASALTESVATSSPRTASTLDPAQQTKALDGLARSLALKAQREPDAQSREASAALSRELTAGTLARQGPVGTTGNLVAPPSVRMRPFEVDVMSSRNRAIILAQ